MVSNSSLATAHSLARNIASPSPSHFSSISRTSSASNLHATYSHSSHAEKRQEAFRWTTLRIIGEHVYTKRSSKADAVLGSPALGSPTVLAANGLICVGTDAGRVFVFDFKQQLKCVCGDEASGRLLTALHWLLLMLSPARTFGPVTALALSHDHTFVAVGHIFGHIQLFDFKTPQTAVRTVNPKTLASVASGRQEGHIIGSRIVALGFIGSRHTAIVSADNQGLAFYHSLGKVLFMDAVDVLRILGKYPDEEPPLAPLPLKHVVNSNGSADPSTDGVTPRPMVHRQSRKPATMLSMLPLPLGTIAHPTDSYQLVALLTPIKLVIVGLKPTAKTWFRRHREGDDIEGKRSRWRGCLSWFPSWGAVKEVNGKANGARTANGRQAKEPLVATDPVLAYAWGRTLNVLRTSEQRISQKVQNKKTGKVEKVEIGKVNFADCGSVTFRSDILALQWLNANVCPSSLSRVICHSI